MEFQAAKERLKQGYLDIGFELVDEHQRELYLTREHVRIRLTEGEIETLARHADALVELKQGPNPCSIVGTSYREQVVRPLRFPVPILGREDTGFVFGDLEGAEPYLEIGQATPLFLNYLRFDPSFIEATLTRFSRLSPVRHEFLEPQEVVQRLRTIRICRLAARSIEEAIEESNLSE